MDRREFLGAGVAGAAACLGGRMGLKQYDGSSGQFVPTPALQYDESKIMPYWKGASCYEYDASVDDFVDTYLNDGLVGFWDFQPHSINGNTVEDRSINQNTGTIHGNPQPSDGIVGQELNFDRDGGADYITVPYSPELNITESNAGFTISAWFRTNLTAGRHGESGHGILERKPEAGGTDADAGYILQIVGRGDYGADTANTVLFSYPTSSGKRTFYCDRTVVGPQVHLAVRYDATADSVTVFVDGFTRLQQSNAPTPTSTMNDLQIGTHRKANGTIDRPLDGAISEIRLYDRPLAGNEIDALAALGAGGGPSFEVELQSEMFYNVVGRAGRNDAVAVYNDSKEKPYRLISYGNAQVNDYGSRGNNLHASNDLQNWTLIEKDITNHRTLQDAVFRNGTYYLYDNVAELWTGPSLDNLTSQGIVEPGLGDLGAFYENGTWYLYPEEDIAAHAPSGNKIGIWTSDRPDGGFVRQGTAVDVSDRPYLSGDADIFKHDGKYWLVSDCEADHPLYGTSLFKSDNLLDWEFVTDDIKDHVAGDLQVLKTPNGIVGFTEFTHNRRGGIGVWDVTYLPE